MGTEYTSKKSAHALSELKNGNKVCMEKSQSKSCLLLNLRNVKVRPFLMVTEYTPVKRIPLRDSMHPMQTFGFYFTVDYYGELLKRVPPS